jgi:drug/metabolite transporter (DMT)-like permease
MLAGCFSLAWMAQFASLLARSCDWRLSALARSGLVFLFALCLARVSGARLVLWRPRILWARSLAGSISLVCTFYVFSSKLNTSEILTLTNTFPIWVAVLSWPLLRERPSASVWLAAGCGVLGVALMRDPKFDGANLAIALALFAALVSAIAMLGLNRIKGVSAPAIVVHFAGVATLVTLGVCLLGGGPPDLAPLRQPRNALLLVGIGLTATLGQLCLTRAFTSGRAAKVSVIGLSQVVFALVLDLALSEPSLGPAKLCGIGLVLAPTAWIMAGRASA